MTLLTVAFAAIIATIVWYKSADARKMKVCVLCFIYWGAFLMWLVDAVVEFLELKAEYFTPQPVDMLNDLYLGLSATAVGLIIWLIILLVKDPKGVVKSVLNGKK